MKLGLFFCLIKIALGLFHSCPLLANVSALYLSWYSDPTTTMTIQWHGEKDDSDRIIWRSACDGEWQTAISTRQTLPSSDVHVHHVTLTNLSPESEYEFSVGADSARYRFRTMPKKLDRPITFAVGSNLLESRKLFRRMSQTIRSYDPDFIVIGGNCGTPANKRLQIGDTALRNWLSFLSEVKKAFVTESGRIIPFLIVPGSEDLQTNRYQLFFSLFAFPSMQLYRTLDFGQYLTLFLLDSGHFHPIDGPQTNWLSQVLHKSQKKTFRFAVYNESAYPSTDETSSSTTQKLRTHWCPLFEQHNLHAVFEHNGRHCKRTFPLKANHIDETGIIYLGEGCWGAQPEKTSDQWYLAKKAKKTGAWLVRLDASKADMKAIDLIDTLIDEYSIAAAR
jgi:hypothetical protein